MYIHSFGQPKLQQLAWPNSHHEGAPFERQDSDEQKNTEQNAKSHTDHHGRNHRWNTKENKF